MPANQLLRMPPWKGECYLIAKPDTVTRINRGLWLRVHSNFWVCEFRSVTGYLWVKECIRYITMRICKGKSRATVESDQAGYMHQAHSFLKFGIGPSSNHHLLPPSSSHSSHWYQFVHLLCSLCTALLVTQHDPKSLMHTHCCMAVTTESHTLNSRDHTSIVSLQFLLLLDDDDISPLTTTQTSTQLLSAPSWLYTTPTPTLCTFMHISATLSSSSFLLNLWLSCLSLFLGQSVQGFDFWLPLCLSLRPFPTSISSSSQWVNGIKKRYSVVPLLYALTLTNSWYLDGEAGDECWGVIVPHFKCLWVLVMHKPRTAQMKPGKEDLD